MGMSASQARYLQLTARKSDVEYQAQQIAQKRLTLAERTEIIAKRYTERMDDRRLYYNANYEVVNKVDENGQPVFDENGNQLTELKYLSDSFKQKRLDFYDITNSYTDTKQPGQGLRIVNTAGKIVVAALPSEAERQKAGLEISDYVVEPTIAPRSTDSAEVYENACDFLENKLKTGEWQIYKPTYSQTTSDVDANNDGELDKIITTTWTESSSYLLDDFSIVDLLFKDNDSAAQAEYTAESATIQSQDKALELRLNQLSTEQKALETELESVGKVIEKNVQESFKTFG